MLKERLNHVEDFRLARAEKSAEDYERMARLYDHLRDGRRRRKAVKLRRDAELMRQRARSYTL